MKANDMKAGKEPSSLKIITIDNCPIVLERIQSMLSEIDNIELLDTSNNLFHAINIVDMKKPDVVILDIHLAVDEEDKINKADQLSDILPDIHLGEDTPAINGIGLLKILRKKHPKMKILILTNLVGLQYRINCIAYGADHFFDKSKDFDKMPETLKKIRLEISLS